jgi:hypothetical protein
MYLRATSTRSSIMSAHSARMSVKHRGVTKPNCLLLNKEINPLKGQGECPSITRPSAPLFQAVIAARREDYRDVYVPTISTAGSSSLPLTRLCLVANTPATHVPTALKGGPQSPFDSVARSSCGPFISCSAVTPYS